MPRVTAIITTFNRKRYLGPAIKSVLAQSFTDFELVILDNSSSDGTEDVVRSFDDNRIRYIKHPPLTIGQQRNLGLREARGEYIGFLDDDDEWLPNKLDRQVEIFQQGPPELALVYGGFVRIDSDGAEFATHHPVLRGRILLDLLWHRDAFTGSASNPLMKSSVLRELRGYNDELCTSEDWELYLRLAERFAIDFTEESILRIRSHRGPRLGDRVGEALKVEALAFNRYKSIMDDRLQSLYLQKMGGKQCRLSLGRDGRKAIIQAILLNPANLTAYAQYLISWLGTTPYQVIHRTYKRFF